MGGVEFCSGECNHDFGGRYDCALFDKVDSRVSKSHSGSNVTFRSANVSCVTSDGFLKVRKCAKIPAPCSVVQDDGGVDVDGTGGLRDGKVTGIGFGGGGLSLWVSCWPTSKFPVGNQPYICGNIHMDRVFGTKHVRCFRAGRDMQNPTPRRNAKEEPE